MRTLILTFTIIAFLSCSTQTDTNTHSPTSTNKSVATPDFNVALNFINDYVGFCNSTSIQTNDTNWVRNHPLLTDNFKNAYYDLINKARKDNPELGLGFDPIFDAQDFPDKGFVVAAADTAAGILTVKGKEWSDFILTLKLVAQDGKYLVDGSGAINIPEYKRARR